MTSQEDNVKPTANQTLPSSNTSSSSTKVSLGGPLKFKMEEFREMKELETAGDTVGIEELKKKVRRRMEAESTLEIKVTKQERSTTASSRSNTSDNLSVNKCKNGVVNQKGPATTISTSKASDNVINNEDKKAAVKKERIITTRKSLPIINKEKQASMNQRKSKSFSSVSRGTIGYPVVNKSKESVANQAKQSSFTSTPKSIGGNLVTNKMKQNVSTHQKKQTSLTSTLKRTGDNLINGKGKQAADRQEKTSSFTWTSKDFNGELHSNNGKQAAINREKVRTKVSSGSSSSTSNLVATKSVERGLQHKEMLNQEKKRKEKFIQERKLKYQQKLEEERKLEKRSVGIRRHQESVVETNRRLEERRRQEKLDGERRRQKASVEAEAQRRHKRVPEGDLRSGHSNVQNKRMTNGSEVSTSTLHKKRMFDERSDVASSSSRVQKRRNTRDGEFDINRLDEVTIKQNMRSIIHSLIRPGRRPIHGIVDDNDDDVMEVSGFEVLREEARSSRLAKKEDEEEERLEQRRRMKKHKDKKFNR